MKLLAFDTSTDSMSVAVSAGSQLWQRSGPGGAQASSTLIPMLLELLAQAGLTVGDLDALAFGRGPGSFTGLRTACSVAQGLGLGANAGAGLPVLAIDSLLALAEEARFQQALSNEGRSLQVLALLDARMDEIYQQRFVHADGQWTALGVCSLVRPENLRLLPADQLLAGNVFEVYRDRLPARPSALAGVSALPTASAMLRLAPALLASGQALSAAQALPLYIRDKVALTTEERAQVKAAQALKP